MTGSVQSLNKFTDKWLVIAIYLSIAGFVLCLDPHAWNQVQHRWTNSGIWMQSLWDEFLDWIGDDSFNLYIYGMNIWNIFLFWFVGSLYLIIDIFAWPKWMARYKVQPKAILDKKMLRSLITVTLYNQLFVAIPFSLLGYYVLKFQGTSPPIRELPSFFRLVRDFALFIPIQEVFAYYTHRMFHHRLLYKWTHKLHHEWTAPIALSAMYNHPLDHLIGNILPSTVGISILNSHFFTSLIWLTWATLRTLNDHSGYQLFTFPSPQRHDFHHLKFTECFGVWGPLDYLHGTETHFQAHLATVQKNK